MGKEWSWRSVRIWVGGLALGVLACALTACGGGGSNGAVRPTPASPPPTTPTTPQPPIDAQLSITNTYAAHAAGYTGQGVTIGVVDSGIMRSNPTVAGRVLDEFIDVDPAQNNTNIDDVVGHGTWVSEIAAGTPFAKFPGGIAPGASLVSARIISDSAPSDSGQPPTPISASDATFFQQVNQQLINAGVMVQNNSWGGLTWDTTNPSVNQAFDAAYSAFVNQHGGLVVFAAGNGSGAQPSTFAQLPNYAPDLAKGWLTVVAVDSNNPTQLASYSDICGNAMNFCLAAPGDVIVLDKDTTASTTNPTYYIVQGTSLAAPQVTGAAALVWQAFPYFTNAQVANTILETATPLGGSQPNPTFGWGELNVGKAVQGPVSLDAFQGGVSFNGITSTWSNGIAGVGQTLIKSGTGTLILTGNLGYSGGTVVSGGTLQSTQPLPLVRAQQGQTGINDVIVQNGGTLGPRTGTTGGVQNAGTVIVQGGDTNIGYYTQTSTGTLAVSLGSILKTGQANLAGTLNVLGADTGYVSNNHQDVLEATGIVNGTFAQLTTSPGVFLNTTIQYTPNTVWLDTTSLKITQAAQAMAITDPASLSAAARVQNGFDTLNSRLAAGTSVAPGVLAGAGAIQHTATPAAASATLQSLSGQLHAASAAMLFDGIDAGDDALTDHFDDLLAGRARPGAWYAGLGRQGDLQRAGYAGASFRSDGGLVGADFRVGAHALLGYAVGASRGHGQLDMAWDHNQTWIDHAMLYGGVFDGSWYAKAQFGGGRFHEDMQRLLLLGGLAAPVGSGFAGNYVAGSLEGGYRFHVGAARITPFVDVRYQRLDQGGFAENGGYGFGLMANARTTGRLQTGVGLRAQDGWRLANGMLMQFDGSAAWRHAARQYGDAFDASFTGFDDWMPVDGVGLSRNESVLRAGLSLWPARTFGLRLGLSREQGDRQHAGSVMLQGIFAF
ncbi:MAG: Outer membrane stress sensor protease DegS [Rhodanobacteraceae bacterium]|jgi:autotransporter-associated beta strand protein|nr:MAG: Outer membrane stress sensor protease DegS [Rhodanobacteraceae bacterium]